MTQYAASQGHSQKYKDATTTVGRTRCAYVLPLITLRSYIIFP